MEKHTFRIDLEQQHFDKCELTLSVNKLIKLSYTLLGTDTEQELFKSDGLHAKIHSVTG